MNLPIDACGLIRPPCPPQLKNIEHRAGVACLNVSDTFSCGLETASASGEAGAFLFRVSKPRHSRTSTNRALANLLISAGGPIFRHEINKPAQMRKADFRYRPAARTPRQPSEMGADHQNLRQAPVGTPAQGKVLITAAMNRLRHPVMDAIRFLGGELSGFPS